MAATEYVIYFASDAEIGETIFYRGEHAITKLERNSDQVAIAAIVYGHRLHIGPAHLSVYHDGVGEAINGIEASTSKSELISQIEALHGWNPDWLDMEISEDSPIPVLIEAATQMTLRDYEVTHIYDNSSDRIARFNQMLSQYQRK